jgi:hypothetical protein
MARRRIFISHSAHRDPSALPVLHQLEAKLKSLNQDYTVLLDHSTLRPGEDWRSALDIWCGACDAAILLVTPDSMQAEYCSYEWSILSYRKARSQNFNILPVYYGATPEDLRGKPHQISEIQGVVFSTIEACWPKIEAWLGKVVTNQDPTSKQAYLLANLLRKELQDPNQRQLDNALSKSNLELADWEPLEDRWEQFAFLLVGLGVPKAVLPLAPLAWAFNGKQDSWKDVLDLVACSWIDNRSALRLEARTCGPCGDRAVALNTEEPRTARLYVVKASRSKVLGLMRCMSKPPRWTARLWQEGSATKRWLAGRLWSCWGPRASIRPGWPNSGSTSPALLSFFYPARIDPPSPVSNG